MHNEHEYETNESKKKLNTTKADYLLLIDCKLHRKCKQTNTPQMVQQ